MVCFLLKFSSTNYGIKYRKDFRNTIKAYNKISPKPIQPKPKDKLKKVCKDIKYKFSENDLVDEDIFLGGGSFGSVKVVSCNLNHQKYALKSIGKYLKLRWVTVIFYR